MRDYFLDTYEEKNEYYRMITGLPPLDDPGIPVRLYEAYLPENFEYSGEFIHEVGIETIREIDGYGVIDMMKQDYPEAKYLDYITAGLTIYEVRKNLDFMLLYVPDQYDYTITQEFISKYQERRDFLLTSVYNTAFEIESEHYHATMQLYLLVMTIVDMLANVQSHIIKKDLLDRRCIEYFFSMYGFPYYKEIPYKYQERLCTNMHHLFREITKIFEMNDIEYYKYWLLKVRRLNSFGELLTNNKIIKTSKKNDTLFHSYIIQSTSNNIIPYPFDHYIQKGNMLLVSINNTVLKERDDYILSADDTIQIYSQADFIVYV